MKERDADMKGGRMTDKLSVKFKGPVTQLLLVLSLRLGRTCRRTGSLTDERPRVGSSACVSIICSFNIFGDCGHKARLAAVGPLCDSCSRRGLRKHEAGVAKKNRVGVRGLTDTGGGFQTGL